MKQLFEAHSSWWPTGQGRPRRGALRLAGVDPGRVAAIPDASYGRLEIFMNGFWSTVCDRNGFTPDSAKVACKALGWKGGVPVNFLQPYSAEFVSEENEVRPADVRQTPIGIAVPRTRARLLHSGYA